MAQQTDSFEFKDENARFGIKDEWMNKPLHIGGQKQQTAVDWFIEQLPMRIINMYHKEIEQVKQMEKEQLVKAWDDGDYAYFYSKETGRDFDNGEEYYKETYEKQ